MAGPGLGEPSAEGVERRLPLEQLHPPMIAALAPRGARSCYKWGVMTDQYVPGSCNIGPAEIALRRRAGHAGVAATAALAAALLRSGLHPAWRLTLAVPAAGAAAGYLQARQRFCADFGFRGVHNFDRPGRRQAVGGDQARAEDRRQAVRIAATSAAVGLGVALVSMSL